MIMTKQTWRSALVVLAISSLILVGCSPAAPTEPTLSPDAIYTAAAQTVEAEIATRAALNPTATMTFTPLPSPTMPLPTAAQPAAGTPAAPAAPAVTAGAGTVAATATLAVAAAPGSSAAKYELVSQDPADHSEIAAGVGFDGSWVIKNTGTTTWTKQYSLVFFIGERLNPGGKTNTYTFTQEVKPGETIKVAADMAAPTKAGEYYSWWKLKDDQGQNFGDLDLTIKVP